MSFMATYNSVKYKSFTELLLTWSTKSPNWILLEMKEPAYNKDVFKLLQELNKMKNISSIFRFYYFFFSIFFYNGDLSSKQKFLFFFIDHFLQKARNQDIYPEKRFSKSTIFHMTYLIKRSENLFHKKIWLSLKLWRAVHTGVTIISKNLTKMIKTLSWLKLKLPHLEKLFKYLEKIPRVVVFCVTVFWASV